MTPRPYPHPAALIFVVAAMPLYAPSPQHNSVWTDISAPGDANLTSLRHDWLGTAAADGETDEHDLRGITPTDNH